MLFNARQSFKRRSAHQKIKWLHMFYKIWIPQNARWMQNCSLCKRESFSFFFQMLVVDTLKPAVITKASWIIERCIFNGLRVLTQTTSVSVFTRQPAEETISNENISQKAIDNNEYWIQVVTILTVHNDLILCLIKECKKYSAVCNTSADMTRT